MISCLILTSGLAMSTSTSGLLIWLSSPSPVTSGRYLKMQTGVTVQKVRRRWHESQRFPSVKAKPAPTPGPVPLLSAGSPPSGLPVPAAVLVDEVCSRLLVVADGLREGHPEATHGPQPLFQLGDLQRGGKKRGMTQTASEGSRGCYSCSFWVTCLLFFMFL